LLIEMSFVRLTKTIEVSAWFRVSLLKQIEAFRELLFSSQEVVARMR
jgi:hypothetical protein